MHRGLPYSCSGLVSSTGAGSDSSLGSGSAGSNTKVQVRDTEHNMQCMWCKVQYAT
jgi:hypothetical protein